MHSAYPFTTEQLESLRSKTDPVAEDVVGELFRHYNLEASKALFRSIPHHFAEKNFPDFLARYVDQPKHLPDWANREQIALGQQVFWKYGREIMLILLCRSLPMSYICANGAEVLTTTARLVDFPKSPQYTRRLIETLQFAINVAEDENQLHTPLGKGPVAIKKVRLMHATIRRYIHEQMEWPTALGHPINQEDQLITMCSFSIEVVKGLQKMGITLSEAERDAYVHLWRVACFLLGVEEKFLPDSYEAACQMSERILSKQAAKSEQGQLLCASCEEFMSRMVPFYVFRRFTEAVFFYLNDPPYRDMMGFSKRHWFWDRVIPWLMEKTLGADQRLENRSWFLAFLIRKLNHFLLKGIVKLVMPGGDFFQLPEKLRR